MKRIFNFCHLCYLCILFNLFALSLSAQYYSIVQEPVCWDSLGTPVQLYSAKVQLSRNAKAVWLGYFDHTQNQIVPTVGTITPGDCNLVRLNSNDTLVNITCMKLTRAVLNTVNGLTYYPRHVLEKHTVTIGGQIVEEKYYEPHTGQLIESPILPVSILHCEDFLIGDFTNMQSFGDTVTATVGDTITITAIGTSHVSISCDINTIDLVKIVFTYNDVLIDGFAYPVGGNNAVLLRPYANHYQESWGYQQMNNIQLIAAGADCECSYKFTHEQSRF